MPGKYLKPLPPVELVRLDFFVDEDGQFKRTRDKHPVGQNRGQSPTVYYMGDIFRKARLLWLFHFGYDPENRVTFADGNPDNCTPDNLLLIQPGERALCVMRAKRGDVALKPRRQSGLIAYAGKPGTITQPEWGEVA